MFERRWDVMRFSEHKNFITEKLMAIKIEVRKYFGSEWRWYVKSFTWINIFFFGWEPELVKLVSWGIWLPFVIKKWQKSFQHFVFIVRTQKLFLLNSGGGYGLPVCISNRHLKLFVPWQSTCSDEVWLWVCVGVGHGRCASRMVGDTRLHVCFLWGTICLIL